MKLLAPIDSVSPNPQNTVKHPDDQVERLAARLRQFGQYIPLVVASDNVILKGNGTYAALRKIGAEQVWIERLPFKSISPEGVAMSIGDNRIAEFSEYDEALVVAQWRALPEDLREFTGFEELDIAALEGVEPDVDDVGGTASEQLGEQFKLVVECKDEEDQRELFDRLSTEGYACKVLTL